MNPVWPVLESAGSKTSRLPQWTVVVVRSVASIVKKAASLAVVLGYLRST